MYIQYRTKDILYMHPIINAPLQSMFIRLALEHLPLLLMTELGVTRITELNTGVSIEALFTGNVFVAHSKQLITEHRGHFVHV